MHSELVLYMYRVRCNVKIIVFSLYPLIRTSSSEMSGTIMSRMDCLCNVPVSELRVARHLVWCFLFRQLFPSSYLYHHHP